MTTRPRSRRFAGPRPPSPSHALLAAAVVTALAASARAQQQFADLPRTGLAAPSGRVHALALADIDADGDLDLVCAADGPNLLLRNDGRGRFTDVTTTSLPPSSTNAFAVAIADVDADGDLDIAFGDYVVPTRLLVNDGSGVFTDETATRMPALTVLTTDLEFADIDGDGDPDLVVGGGRSNAGSNRVFLNDGAGTFRDGTNGRLPQTSRWTNAIALGDVDQDGDLDLITGNGYYTPGHWTTGGAYVNPRRGGQNRLYLNDGSGTFVDATATHLPPDNDWTMAVGFGDLDGDGDLDLVAGNQILENNGTGVFANQRTAPGAVWPQCLALGDVDGDDDIDVVVVDDGQHPGSCRLWQNDGAGNFIDATSRLPPLVFPLSAVLGDLDGDDDLDVVLGEEVWVYFPPLATWLPGGFGLRPLTNLRRQLHAPTGPRLGQPYTLDAYLRYDPPGTTDLAVLYVSGAPAAIPLPPFGTVGIDPLSAVQLPLVAVAQPAGVGSIRVFVPNAPSLVGQTVYSQALLIAGLSDIRLSDVVADVVR